ncbi:MAG: hypothetical protein RMJ98_17905 [Myxococcales bacterium]|nr:hypothetical protein [Myxococcales bacterium]
MKASPLPQSSPRPELPTLPEATSEMRLKTATPWPPLSEEVDDPHLRWIDAFLSSDVLSLLDDE